MQAKLKVGDCKDLYQYWGDRLAGALCKTDDCILNLASREYSSSVTNHLPSGVRLVTCIFGEMHSGKIVEKGTLCKMARGEMVRFLAEQGGETPKQAKAFDRLNYRFSPDHSDENTLVFIRNHTGRR